MMSPENRKVIKRLEKERNELLKSRPELRALQAEIDNRLKVIGENQILRLHLIHSMMNNHLRLRFLPALRGLMTLLKEIKKETGKRSPHLKLIQKKDD